MKSASTYYVKHGIRGALMTKNLTLAIDEDLLDRARILAIKRRTSLTGMIREYLEGLVRADDQYQQASERLRQRMAAPDARVGRRTWTRDDLHER